MSIDLEQPQVIRSAAAAKRAAVSRATIFNWIKRGHLPAKVIDGVTLIKISDLDALIGLDDQ